MQLAWPNPAENQTVSQAVDFVAEAAAAGFPNGVLAVNTEQTLPGEITNFILVDSKGQPTDTTVPGWPSGDFRAAFCIYIPGQASGRWLNIGTTKQDMKNDSISLAQALTPPAQPGAIAINR